MSTAVSQRAALSHDLHVRLSPSLFDRLSFAADRSGITAPALTRAVLSDRLPLLPADEVTR